MKVSRHTNRNICGVNISMLIKNKNQRGSIMITVIVVIAILLVLGVVLLDSSVQGFKITKHEQTSELAYNASESAIQRCYAFINNFCSIKSNYDGIGVFTSEEDYAGKVIDNKIMPALKSNTPSDIQTQFPDMAMYKIGLSSMSSVLPDVNIAYVEIKLNFLRVLDKAVNGDAHKIKVAIGVYANANYDKTGDKASNKKVFAEIEVVMFIPRGFTLNAAIYSIGDLMVDNIDAQVTGDVVAFGTSPEYANQMEQYYYGGIYAKNNGHLSVNGNAYSRGMIRTGKYNNIEDPSTIYVYKDAIANGINIFGKNQKIVVGRNAYTFDDLELNGENSVIAVNGSYIGLSNNISAQNHDESSAIINNAIVHNPGSDDSLKSRIVINGDVIINGGAFRLDPTNIDEDTKVLSVDQRTPQIEDASVVAADDGFFSPKYKEYLDGIANNTITYPDPFPEKVTEQNYYHKWLFDNRSNAIGFANLIQRWTPKIIDFTDETTTAADVVTNLLPWITTVDNTRYAFSLDTANAGRNDTFEYDSPLGTSISGFCHYEIGANDDIYFMENGVSKIDKIKFINNDFFIDNIKDHPADNPADEEINKYWKNFWGDLPAADEWKGVGTASGDPLSTKLTEIKNMLLPKTTIFASRDYDYDVNEINNTNNDAEDSPNNLFLTIGDKLNASYPTGVVPSILIDKNSYVFNYPLGQTGTINISDVISNRASIYRTNGVFISDQEEEEFKNKYFLFINNSPSLELKIMGKVNGIIYSMGKVVIEDGAEVTGSIIAAGNGYTDTAPYYLNDQSSASGDQYLPKIKGNGDNLSRLDDGSYAGVYFNEPISTILTSKAKVHFPGTEKLFNKFIVQTEDLASSMDLKSIFDF